MFGGPEFRHVSKYTPKDVLASRIYMNDMGVGVGDDTLDTDFEDFPTLL